MAAPSSGARLQAPGLDIEDLLKAVLDVEHKTQHLESSSDLISGIMELP